MLYTGSGKFKIVNDETGTYQEFTVPKTIIKDTRLLSPYCTQLCNYNLHRPHFTCLTCRFRRVYEGKMPNRIPVKIHMVFVRLDRKHSKLKNMIIKKLFTLIEFLSN